MKTIMLNPWFTLPGILSLAVAISLPACSGGYGAANPTTSKTTTPPASGNSVNLSNFAISPAAITVKAGIMVTWTNKDSTSHTVVSDSGVFQSGNLAQNGTYSYTFSTWELMPTIVPSTPQ